MRRRGTDLLAGHPGVGLIERMHVPLGRLGHPGACLAAPVPFRVAFAVQLTGAGDPVVDVLAEFNEKASDAAGDVSRHVDFLPTAEAGEFHGAVYS